MTSETSPYSSWDLERVSEARRAFRDTLDQADIVGEITNLEQALLAAIRAADAVKPPPDMPKPLPNPTAFFRKLADALLDLADPGTEVEMVNGFNAQQRWQDFWVTVEGAVWFISCRPNRRHTQLPLTAAPARYDSLGKGLPE